MPFYILHCHFAYYISNGMLLHIYFHTHYSEEAGVQGNRNANVLYIDGGRHVLHSPGFKWIFSSLYVCLCKVYLSTSIIVSEVTFELDCAGLQHCPTEDKGFHLRSVRKKIGSD